MLVELSPCLRPLRATAAGGLSLFYPEVCQVCQGERATPAEGYVGSRCRAEFRFIVPPHCERCGLPFRGALTAPFECANCREMELHFSSARSVVAAEGPVLEIIHRYKYQRALWFEPCLAGLLAGGAGESLGTGGWNLIVPVPLHPVREREREFNQAARLARRLGAATGLPVRADLLRRVLRTRTQTLLTRAERAENVARAFAPRPGRRLDGERVVVVDDVLTTGATTSACARVLRELGAGDVCVWTVARGLIH
jgi:ComF family protein